MKEHFEIRSKTPQGILKSSGRISFKNRMTEKGKSIPKDGQIPEKTFLARFYDVKDNDKKQKRADKMENSRPHFGVLGQVEFVEFLESFYFGCHL